ncbi:hypothetical protein GCM10027589_51760 [Actinocorallia lasiicapitis]
MTASDPAALLRELPESQHAFFVAQYRALWVDAINPDRFQDVQRFLDFWRLHLNRSGDPGFAREIADHLRRARETPMIPLAERERLRVGASHRADLRRRARRDRWIRTQVTGLLSEQ